MRYRLLLALWLITDVILFTGSYVLAYFLRVGWIVSTDFPLDRFLWATISTVPAWLLVLATTRVFSLARNQQSLRNFAYLCYAALVGVAFFTLVYYFRFKYSFGGISRLLLLEALILSASITWLWHILYDLFKRAMLRLSPPSFPTLIVGVTRESKAMIESLKRNRSPFTPVAILDGRGAKEKEIHGVPVEGKLDKLEETIRRKKITHMIQASDLEQTLNLLSACRHHGITYMLLPSVLGIVDRDKRVEDLEGYPVTVVRPRRAEILSYFR